MKKIKFDKLTLGVCYYPEHWDRKMWADDLVKMKECGIEVVRIGEFAWNMFEPDDGVFTFDFFDEFMDLALKENMKVIFGTPTATAPVWLSEKYPEILNADIDGNLYYNGMRRQNNLTSPVYRRYSSRIVEKLAEHYSGYSNLIGWQLDNEINCEQDHYYAETDHKAFREHLKNKYKTIENLNKEMGTVFWNQTYNDWEQIYLTRKSNTNGETNPHMKLEEKRFVSDTVISFFKMQADIIKKYRRTGQFITTNGVFRFIDYHKLTDEILDFITYDNYPNFAFELGCKPMNDMRDRNTSRNLSYIRSISNPFGIMEQQTGGGGWNCRMLQPMPKPGQMRLWTLQANAHGADFISYFRWRTCRFGTEMYWYGLNDYSNEPNRRIDELKKIHNDTEKISEIAGSEYKAEVALIRDYDNEWDEDCDRWQVICSQKSNDAWFCMMQKNHISFDYVYINDSTDLKEIEKYKQIVYTHPTILTQSRADLLKKYAEKGGKVIMGCRSGIKLINGHCHNMPLPGYAQDLCGVNVSEFTILSDFDETEYIVYNGMKATAPVYNDILEVTDAKEIGRFENNHYDGKTAMTEKSIGDGYIYYVGSAFNEDTAEMLAKITGMKPVCGLSEILDVPPELEIAVRENEKYEYIFMLNYDGKEREFNLKTALTEIISGKEMNGEIVIPGYDCLIFRKDR